LTKNPLVYSVSYLNVGDLWFFWGAKPTKAPMATGLVTNRYLFRKLLPNIVSWDIGLLDAQQWLQCFTFNGYCD